MFNDLPDPLSASALEKEHTSEEDETGPLVPGLNKGK
jgi:hypothetical protein